MHKQSCILCGSENIAVKEKISYRDLKSIYKRALKIDIDECFCASFNDRFLPLYVCRDCKIEFFPPELAGNNAFYEKLGVHEWYYGADKWEFTEAIKEFKEVKSVLEVGCGDGHFMELMKKYYPDTRVIGLELNREAIEKNHRHNFDAREQTIEKFADEKVNHEAFDAICSFQVLEHVQNPKAFIESSLKCLKKGGFLFVSVPNRDGFTKYLVNDILNMPPHHISRWGHYVIENVSKLFNLQIKSFKEEPIAEYHKKSYRMALLKKHISNFIGVKFRSVEPSSSLLYKTVQSFAFILDIMIPKRFWKYTKFTGHTLYATFIKK